MSDKNQKECFLTVVIKSLNEEENISQCIESILNATKGIDCQIYLIDSLSTDKTVTVAKKFPVHILQIANDNDRRCGVNGQVGYLFSNSVYLLMIDADMLLKKEFILGALSVLENETNLAAVGGVLDERSLTIEYRQREKRASNPVLRQSILHLTGGGLYRVSALDCIGYFTNINLHSCEEFELGLRLNEAGFSIVKIPLVWAIHFGHTKHPLKLLLSRWRSGYVLGPGELLRACIFRPYFFKALLAHKHIVLNIMALFLVAFISLFDFSYIHFFYIWFAVVLLFLLVKKRNVLEALYSLFVWNVYSVGMVRGFFNKYRQPVEQIDVNILY